MTAVTIKTFFFLSFSAKNFLLDGNTAYDIAKNNAATGQGRASEKVKAKALVQLLDPITPKERADFMKPIVKKAFDAIEKNDYALLEESLENGCIPYATNGGYTLLDKACHKNDVPISVVNSLLARGIESPYEAVRAACENGRLDVLQAIHATGRKLRFSVNGMCFLPNFFST